MYCTVSSKTKGRHVIHVKFRSIIFSFLQKQQKNDIHNFLTNVKKYTKVIFPNFSEYTPNFCEEKKKEKSVLKV